MAETPFQELKLCVPSEMNPPLNVQLVTDEAGLQLVADFLGRETVFGFDLETNVCDAFTARIVRTIQLGNKHEQYVIDLLPFAQRAGLTLAETQGREQLHEIYKPIFDVLRPALDSQTHLKVGANLEFEVICLLWCFGEYVWNLYDIQRAEQVLYAGIVGFYEKGFWALDDLVGRYCGLKVDKTQQTTFDLETPLNQEQIIYAGLDTRFPLAVKIGQHKKITKIGLWKPIEIENNAIVAFGALHVNGIYCDEAKWTALYEASCKEHEDNVAALDEYFLPLFGDKNAPLPFDLEALEATWRGCDEESENEVLWKTDLAQTEDKAKRKELRDLIKAAKEKRKAKKPDARKAYMDARKIATALKNDRWEKDDDGNLVDCYAGKAAINLGSTQKVLEALRTITGLNAGQLVDSNDKTLEKYKKKHPVIPLIQKYRETKKTLENYGLEFLRKYVNPVTGRIHSRFKQMGAETGRTSSTNPNIQNIKKEHKYRACFTAQRPGYRILTLDFSGCELRIIAEMSGEQSWIDALNNDDDLHSVVAALLKAKEWNEATCKGGEPGVDDDGNPIELPPCRFSKERKTCKCPGHKKQRKPAKNMNFGIAYGLSKYGLAAQLGITPDEAQELIDAYEAGCPQVIAFLDKCAKHAKMHFESRTITGRRRAFKQPSWEEAKRKLTQKLGRPPDAKEVNKAFKMMYLSIEREGKNAPIQGGNADLSKLAMGCGYDKDGKPFIFHILRKYKARLINFVHDEFVIEVAEEFAEQCFKEVGDAMTRAGAELFKRVRFTWDGHNELYWYKD